VTLEGSFEGIKYYLSPNFSRLNDISVSTRPRARAQQGTIQARGVRVMDVCRGKIQASCVTVRGAILPRGAIVGLV